MKKRLETTTARCQSCGRYFFRTFKTRRPVFCLECSEYRAREANKARQRAFRQRQREAAKSQHEKAAAELPRPVRSGRPKGATRPVSDPASVGLYADMPDPGRTTNRRKVGLK
jgi:hypothetical protein